MAHRAAPVKPWSPLGEEKTNRVDASRTNEKQRHHSEAALPFDSFHDRRPLIKRDEGPGMVSRPAWDMLEQLDRSQSGAENPPEQSHKPAAREPGTAGIAATLFSRQHPFRQLIRDKEEEDQLKAARKTDREKAKQQRRDEEYKRALADYERNGPPAPMFF